MAGAQGRTWRREVLQGSATEGGEVLPIGFPHSLIILSYNTQGRQSTEHHPQ